MIAIVYPQFYGIGGIARYLDSFLSNLPITHPTIYLITGDENRVERNYPNVEIIHIPFTSNRFSLFLWARKVRRMVIQLYDEKKIELINFHIPPLIPGLFLPKKIPVILTAHTTYLGMSGNIYQTRHFESSWNILSLRIKYWLERYIFNRCYKIISLTEQGRQEVINYRIKKHISIIPNGVDNKVFSPEKSVRNNIDVLFSGRIERRKGSHAMIEVCRLLTIKKPDIKICIVGYGEDEIFVQDKLHQLKNNVDFVGKVDFSRMKKYYSQSCVYVSTSYYEGLPGTCLEAMAMELPVVVWDFLFYKNLVIQGKTGISVYPNHYQHMADTIVDLLADKSAAKIMGNNARLLIERQYNWSKLSSKILKELQI